MNKQKGTKLAFFFVSGSCLSLLIAVFFPFFFVLFFFNLIIFEPNNLISIYCFYENTTFIWFWEKKENHIHVRQTLQFKPSKLFLFVRICSFISSMLNLRGVKHIHHIHANPISTVFQFHPNKKGKICNNKYNEYRLKSDYFSKISKIL